MVSDNQKKITLGLNIVTGYILFSIFFYCCGGSIPLFYPGEALFKWFHAASFFVPVYTFLLGRINMISPFNRKALLRLNLFILPFISSAVVFKIAIGDTSPMISFFTLAFGKTAAMVINIILVAIEIPIIFKISNYVYPEAYSPIFNWKEIREQILPDTVYAENREEREAFHQEVESRIEEQKSTITESAPSVPFSPLTPPSFPSQADHIAVNKETVQQDNKSIDDLVQRVLKGEEIGEKAEIKPEVKEPSSFDKMPVEQDPAIAFLQDIALAKDPSTEDRIVEPEAAIENEIFEEPDMDETVIQTEEPYFQEDVFYEDGNGSLDSEPEREEFSAESVHVNHLIDSLDSVLEDDDNVPSEISEKLSPEGTTPEGHLIEPAKPKKKKRKVSRYEVPVEGILTEYDSDGYSTIDDDTRKAAAVLEQTLLEFKIDAKVTGISRGPVITMFELLPAPGVKISKITALQDNIALRLAASRVRIVAPIPGKHAVGIEVPNKKRSIVAYSELVSSDKMYDEDIQIPIVLGKDISGNEQVVDLSRTPHLLIAGSTGSGKSVCVNSLICSILYRRSPDQVKLIMVDPKIVELKLYNDIPHLLTPVITEPKKAFQAVQWALAEMERRYALLDGMGVRDIKTYNKRIREREIATNHLPFIVLVIDEFADLMATSGKELEGIIARLAAMSRAVGIHLVLATQRPSTDVITGLIKANFPSRIAFMVASSTDSRIIIDSGGAEKLLGRGDMLFTSAWDPFPSRMQGAFLSEEEVERVVTHVKTLGEPEYIDDEMFVEEDDDLDEFALSSSSSDMLYDKALDIVINSGKASASYLQRRLKIGYNRAARLVEEMEARGIVGPANGSKAREVLHIPDRVRSEEPSMG